jgi:RNA polymerase sigma-70 factor (ECF subfamily)
MPTECAKARISEHEFSEIYDAHAEKIYRFVYYKTLHRETAEDLTSHTFLKALEHIDQFDSSRGSITVWLYRIARNLVIDHFRKKRRTVDIDDVWDLASSENVEAGALDRAQLAEIKEALAKLPAEQRDIVILRVWEDLPYREIAGIMGKTESACKMMFSRVMSRLKDALVPALIMLFFFRNSLMA